MAPLSLQKDRDPSYYYGFIILPIIIGSHSRTNKNNYSMLRMSYVPPELFNVITMDTQRSRSYYHHLIGKAIEVKCVREISSQWLGSDRAKV